MNDVGCNASHVHRFGRGKTGAHFFCGTLAKYKRVVMAKEEKRRQRRREALGMAVDNGDDEDETNAALQEELPFLLENEFEEIIGFVGKTSATSLVCLGAVTRCTYHRELLARCWIPVRALRLSIAVSGIVPCFFSFLCCDSDRF